MNNGQIHVQADMLQTIFCKNVSVDKNLKDIKKETFRQESGAKQTLVLILDSKKWKLNQRAFHYRNRN